jgi:pyruvate/2-oxoglutarate dehydrogenase complex dihydrolipoamide acyltransferase (E2) component
VKATLKMPRLSMNMEEATVAKWRKKPGERFTKGEPLYEIETEKVTTDVEAPCDGTLLKIVAEEKSVVPVGGPVCTIET